MVDGIGGPEGLRREKDFYIPRFDIVAYTGDEYKIGNIFVEFCYYENIFTPFSYFNVTFQDAIDFPTLLPIFGEERIRVEWTRQELPSGSSEGGFLPPISIDMPVYKINGRSTNPNDRKVQVYTLHCISDEALNNLRRKVRRGFVDVPYSEMVQVVYDEYIRSSKDLNLDPTEGNRNFCVMNMTPSEFIGYVSNKSICPVAGGCLYFFYEDYQNFNFRSLANLFDQEPIKILNYAVKNVLKQGSGAEAKPRNLERDIATVERYSQNSFDLISQIASGEYSSKVWYIDPIRSRYEIKEFDLDQEWDSLPHLDKVKPYTPEGSRALRAPDSSVDAMWTNFGQDGVEHIFSKDSSIRPFQFEDQHQRVTSQVKQLFRHSIDVTIPGTPVIKAGQTIQFDLPENLGKVSKDFPEEKDAYLQGKYLIVGVKHVMEKTEWNLVLTIVKDSFYSDIRHRDPEEEYDQNLIY